jgi:hypothetical protein
MNHRFVLAGLSGGPEQQDFGWRTRVASAEQSSPEHSGGVEGDGIAGRDQVDEIREAPVLKAA